jgi:hypothetical protein
MSAYADDEISWLQEQIDAGMGYRFIAAAFKRPMTKNAIAGLVSRGFLTPPANFRNKPRRPPEEKERTEKQIREMLSLCLTVGEMANQIGISTRSVNRILAALGLSARKPRVSVPSKRTNRERSAILYAVPPVVDFGKPLVCIDMAGGPEIKLNECKYAIGVDEWGHHSFCGTPTNESSYCNYHHAVTHKPIFMCEAAE